MSAVFPPISISFHKLFRYYEEEILYPIGGVIAIHNYKHNHQRYINLPNPEKEISVIAVTLKKKCIAVAERQEVGEKPRIYVYDITTLQRKTVLSIPFDINTREFMCMMFTHDGTRIAALTGGPDFFMYYYNWQSGKIESQAKANNPPSIPGPVTDMAINPKDATIVVFVGVSLFRLLSMSENVWRQYGFQKAQNFSILSVCWLTDDRVLASCEDGRILIVQSGDLNGVYYVNEINEINIVTVTESKKEPQKSLSRTFSKQVFSKVLEKKGQKIRCAVAIKTGFLFSQKSGEVVYFEKTSKTSYKKSTTFFIKQDVLCSEADYNELYFVHCISSNPSGTKLICTTRRSQIYWVDLENSKMNIREFDTFEEPLHHGPVVGLSTCLWKPIFISCGQYDNSVRIWDYTTMKLLLNQTFIEIVLCVSLHPTGLYALIGFTDKVRFFLVLIQELQVYREFDVQNSHILAFSHNGHFFAVESDHNILVFSSITFQQVACFCGHYQQITSLQWSSNDLSLYSSSINGAVYQWSIDQNTRVADVVMHDTEIKGIVAYDEKKIICIGRDGYIKEIVDAKVVLNKNLDHEHGSTLDAIMSLEKSKALLLAGTNGILIMLKYPIDEELEFTSFSMHNAAVTQFCVMNKQQSMVSCAMDGTICVWDIILPSTDIVEVSTYFEEILINTKELSEKNHNLLHLTSRLSEITTEHQFEIRHLESTYENKIKQIEDANAESLKTIKKRMKALEKEHSMELNRVHLDITQMKQNHTHQMDKMDSDFNGKLLYEFQKYDSLKDEIQRMRLHYESEFQKIEDTKNAESEAQKLQFQQQIGNLQETLNKLLKTQETERLRSNETISGLRQEFTDQCNALKADYELRIKSMRETNESLKSELGVTKISLLKLEKEKEKYEADKASAENEYETLKQKYNDLFNNTGKLKQIIEEKKKHIDDEKKQRIEWKRKLKDMEVVRAEFEHKTNDVEKEMKLMQKQLIAKQEEMHKLQKNVKHEEREKMKLQTEILQMTGKLQAKDTIIQDQKKQLYDSKIQLSNIKRDIILLKDLIQNADKLKQEVKVSVFLR